MLTEESKRRQNELKKLLFSMADSCFDSQATQRTAAKLKGLYTDGFRHSYSEFFPLIVEISKDSNSYSLDYLSNNLELLQSFVEQSCTSGSKEFEDLYTPLSKLCDHINLEIGRFSHYSVSEQRVADLETKTGSCRRILKKQQMNYLMRKRK